MSAVTEPTVRTYQLDEPVRGAFMHPILGEVTYSFQAGTIQPASEQEELVLDQQLVPAGLATVVSGPTGTRFVSAGNTAKEAAIAKAEKATAAKATRSSKATPTDPAEGSE